MPNSPTEHSKSAPGGTTDPQRSVARTTPPSDVEDPTKPGGVPKNLAASLGVSSWPYSDAALVEALKTKGEHERTKQEFFKFEAYKTVLQVLETASQLRIPGESIPILFNGNDEMAKKLLSSFTGGGQSERPPILSQPSPVSATLNPPAKSPKTPMRTGQLTSPSDLYPPLSGKAGLGPPLDSSTVSTPTGQFPANEFFKGAQGQSYAPRAHQQSQPGSQRHSISIEHAQSSPERMTPGHRHTVSAMPTYGSVSPSVYPTSQQQQQQQQGGPVVQGYYPPQLMPGVGIPQLQHTQAAAPPQPAAAGSISMNVPPINPPLPSLPLQMVHPPSPSRNVVHFSQAPQPQTLQQQPQQPQFHQQPQQQPHQPQQLPPQQPQQPQQQEQQQQQQQQQQQHQQQPQQRIQIPPHLPPPQSRSGLPSPTGYDTSQSTQERAGTKRPLTSSGSATSTPASTTGRPKTHRHSLSTGADLQIHQWKPKQLLRDNRWRITNPFSKPKEKRTEEAQSSSVASGAGDQSHTTAAAASVEGEQHRPVEQPRESVTAQTTPARSYRPPTTAAVVAAHNNRRRSASSPRRRSAHSVGLDTSFVSPMDDEHRRDEGVAVLVSLASEQRRRDSDVLRRERAASNTPDIPRLHEHVETDSTRSPVQSPASKQQAFRR